MLPGLWPSIRYVKVPTKIIYQLGITVGRLNSRLFSISFYLSIIYSLVIRSQDPSVNVVLLEDSAAVIGVMIAGSCMALSSLTNTPIPDAIGCLLVGCLLGSVASFIIYTNVAALVGRLVLFLT